MAQRQRDDITLTGWGACVAQRSKHVQLCTCCCGHKELASECRVCRSESTKGGRNHGRKLTEVGHIQSLLALSNASVPQVRALHTFTKEVLHRLHSNTKGEL
jgi:hypothetical protein